MSSININLTDAVNEELGGNKNTMESPLPQKLKRFEEGKSLDKKYSETNEQREIHVGGSSQNSFSAIVVQNIDR